VYRSPTMRLPPSRIWLLAACGWLAVLLLHASARLQTQRNWPADSTNIFLFNGIFSQVACVVNPQKPHVELDFFPVAGVPDFRCAHPALESTAEILAAWLVPVTAIYVLVRLVRPNREFVPEPASRYSSR